MRILRHKCFLLWFFLPAWFIVSFAQEAVPAELRRYQGARTIVDYSPAEAQKAYKELRGVEPAENQEGLTALLQKVGEAVRSFFDDFPKTTALERVSQERTEPGQTEQLYHQQDYYYLISPQENIAGVGFEEYRTSLKDERLNPQDLKSSFLLTSGYATHPVYFHPTQQKGLRFRYLGRQRSERNAFVIAFAQRPESAEIKRYLTTDTQVIPILVQGIAFIDPDTYQVIRMRSDLLAPRIDVGLEFQTMTIRFGEVRFQGISQGFWLPQEVEVTMRIQGYFFRNRHRYSQYRLFTVESQDGPKVPIRK